MTLKYHFNARKGSILDSVAKTKATLNGVPTFENTEKGLAMLFPETAYDGLRTNLSENMPTTVMSLCFWIKPRDNTNTSYVFNQDDGSTDRSVVIGFQSGYINFYDGDYPTGTAADTQIPVSNNEWAHIIMATDGTKVYAWKNNVLVVEETGDWDCLATTAFNISGYSSANQIDAYVGDVKIYDTLLTAQERDKEYDEFLHASLLAPPKSNFQYSKPTSLNVDGLVSAFNMIPSEDGVLTDISGEGNNGAITGALATNEGMQFDGVDDKVVLGNLGNMKSIAFRIKLSSTTEQILEGAANDKLILASGGTLTYAEYDNAYINGVDSNAISADVWHNVVITSSTNVDNSAATLALNDTAYGAFEIADLKFYNKELTSQEAKDYHNSFAKQVNFRDNLAFEAADDDQVVVPRDFINGTGSYKINELTAQDTVLKHLDTGSKYLECSSAGTTAFQSSQAYGTWEFDLYKGANGNNTYVNFISNGTNSPINNQGYYICIYSAGANNEKIYFYKSNGTSQSYLFYTDASYVADNTWYRIKITRTTAGVFTVYIKGGSFGDDSWTLVDATGGSGTNPTAADATYTTSAYSVLDLDVGDKVSNFKYTKGVEQ